MKVWWEQGWEEIEKETVLEDRALVTHLEVGAMTVGWAIQRSSRWVSATSQRLCPVLGTQRQVSPNWCSRGIHPREAEKDTNKLSLSELKALFREECYIKGHMRMGRAAEREVSQMLCSQLAWYQEGLEIFSFLCCSLLPTRGLFILRTLSLTRSSFIIMIWIYHQ